MDSEWHPVFLFSGENDQRNLFYQNPIRAAQSYPEAEPKELGYWSKPFYLDERSVPVITYSMPLRRRMERFTAYWGWKLPWII